MLALRRVQGRRFGWVGLFVLAGLMVPLGASVHATGTGPRPLASSPVHFLQVQPDQSWVGISTVGFPSPPNRASGAMAYDSIDSYAVMFGGCNHRTCPLADTWKYEAGNWTNLTASLPLAPPARQGAEMVNDLADHALVLFGGLGAGGALSDTWEFAGGSWSAVSITGPSPAPRSFAQATYDPVRGAVVLFGGRSTAGTLFGDTWAYSSGTWTNLTGRLAESPPARSTGVLSYDPVEGYSVLFGGQGIASQYLGDTWTFGPLGWVNLTAAAIPSPLARLNTTLSFDSGRDTLLLFGGFNSVALSDTWQFSAGAWAPLSANLSSSPGARYSSMAAYDSHDGYLVLFGGYLGGSRYATWVLLSPLATSIASPPSTATTGAPLTLVGSVTGGLAPYVATWQFGDGSAAVTGLVAGHTFSRPGTYVILFSVTDAASDASSSNASVLVRFNPLNVTIQTSAPSGKVGSSITFTAAVSGGAAPYTYAWSSPAGVCTGGQGPVLACAPSSEGTLQVSVTVTDTSGQSVSTGVAIPVAPSSSSGSATSPTPSPATPALGKSSSAWVVLLPLAVALAGALAVGLVMYVAGRRRARAQLGNRPLCYAVPAWSETPPEFQPGTGDGSAVEAWGRVEPPKTGE